MTTPYSEGGPCSKCGALPCQCEEGWTAAGVDAPHIDDSPAYREMQAEQRMTPRERWLKSQGITKQCVACGASGHTYLECPVHPFGGLVAGALGVPDLLGTHPTPIPPKDTLPPVAVAPEGEAAPWSPPSRPIDPPGLKGGPGAQHDLTVERLTLGKFAHLRAVKVDGDCVHLPPGVSLPASEPTMLGCTPARVAELLALEQQNGWDKQREAFIRALEKARLGNECVCKERDQAQEALRSICISLGFDPSDGEGTSPEEVVDFVKSELARNRRLTTSLHRRTQQAESAGLEWPRFTEYVKTQRTGRYFPALLARGYLEMTRKAQKIRACLAALVLGEHGTTEEQLPELRKLLEMVAPGEDRDVILNAVDILLETQPAAATQAQQSTAEPTKESQHNDPTH